jgi:hypothetical protein
MHYLLDYDTVKNLLSYVLLEFFVLDIPMFVLHKKGLNQLLPPELHIKKLMLVLAFCFNFLPCFFSLSFSFSSLLLYTFLLFLKADLKSSIAFFILLYSISKAYCLPAYSKAFILRKFSLSVYCLEHLFKFPDCL